MLVDRGGLVELAGAGERVRLAAQQVALPGGVPRTERERDLGRAWRRGGRRAPPRRPRRPDRVVRGIRRMAGREPVLDDGLRVELRPRPARPRTRARAPRASPPSSRRRACEHRRAHVVVRRVQDCRAVDLAHRREALGRELRGFVEPADHTGRVRRDLDGQRPRRHARHRDDG